MLNASQKRQAECRVQTGHVECPMLVYANNEKRNEIECPSKA